MSLIIPDGNGEAVCSITLPGDAGPGLVVFGFEWDNLATPDDVAASIAEIFGDHIMNRLSDETALVKVRCVINDAGTELEGVWTGNDPGLSTAPATTPQVALLLRKTTGLAGREHRGRMYLPGVPENAVETSGAIDPSFLSDTQSSVNTFMSDLTTAGHPMLLFHSDIATPADTVVSLLVDGKCATQRRRLRD